MRSVGWFTALVLVMTTGACASGDGSDDAAAAKAKSEIDAARNRYVAAWKAADADEITGLYANDGVVLYPNQPAITGRNEIREYFRSFFTEFVQDDFQLTSSEIEVGGSWAFDRGTYRWKATPRAGGAAVEDHGKYLVILRREADGSWRVARDMDNSDRPLSQATRGAG